MSLNEENVISRAKANNETASCCEARARKVAQSATNNLNDVAWILDDPDFCVAFEIERCTESVSAMGRAVTSVERLPFRGVIQPATPSELERLPEADRLKASIIVCSREYLSPGQMPEGSAPDIVFWKGRRYEVVSVESWGCYDRAIAQLLPESSNE